MSLYMMVAAMRFNEADGISKKIVLQAAALSNENEKSILLCFGESSILKLFFENGLLIEKKKVASCEDLHSGNLRSTKNEIIAIRKLLETAKKEIMKSKPVMLYIRHMIPQLKLLSLLHKAKKNNVRVGYEIPTYPYYKEQMSVSHNKPKTLVKLMIETIFWPLIYYYIDKLFVMCCNSNAFFFNKMVSIRNGYSGDNKEFVSRSTTDLVMIGVGTIYPYHGYDRIIRAMKKCGCKLASGGDIIFHIVGQSEEIEKLKTSVSEKEKNNIIFHGTKYGDELTKLYYECNLGIGTMALSLRNADVDTAIKNVEYFAHDLPVLTSGRIFDIPDSMGIYLVQKDSHYVDFEKAAKLVSMYYRNTNREKAIKELLQSFTWNHIMKCAINSVNNL